jgi:ubiquinol-cytochrome c reductase cytochrome c1 subunit
MRINLTATVLALVFCAGTGVVSAAEGGHAAGWQREASNEIGNLPSLQRGARNFLAYCSGCHSLKFVRYSRVCSDLKIGEKQCQDLLVRPGDKPTDYIKASMPAADATEWFGKAPPDLSLEARSRGTDWIFNFLTTFYADPASRQTGVNNLQLPGTAMPHVLSSLQGVQNAVWKNVESKDAEGKPVVTREFDSFEPGVPGSVTREEYDEFVRDLVNFLQYAGDPTQLQREGLGIWVVLFLLMFTGIAYLLKKEYWKDVR